MKKIIHILLLIAAVFAFGSAAYAEDAVLYEGAAMETGAEAVDLDGWGKELFSKAVFEADVRFKETGAGITLRSADNQKGGTSIRAVDRDGKMTLAADGGTGSYFIYYIELDPDTWYHIKLIGSYGVTDGMVDMVVDTYDKDKNITDTKNYYVILMNEMYASSGVGPEHIRVEAGTCVDNVKVTEMKPDGIKLSAPAGMITPGSTVDVSAKLTREGEAFDYDMPITYTVNTYTVNTYTVSGEGAEISPEGVLTVSADAPAGKITVTASADGMTDSAELEIVSGDVFTVTEAVFSEDNSVLEGVKAVKNFSYSASAVFTTAVYDENGTMRAAYAKTVPAKEIARGAETEIVLDAAMPEGFDPDTWTVDISAWSASAQCALTLPDGDTLGVRSVFESNGGAVEWIEDRETVIGMLNGKTMLLQLENSVIYIDGAAVQLENAPATTDDVTYADRALFEKMI